MKKQIKNRFCYPNQFQFLSKTDRFSTLNRIGFALNYKTRTGLIGFKNPTCSRVFLRAPNSPKESH
jgi:hypothetical protein